MATDRKIPVLFFGRATDNTVRKQAEWAWEELVDKLLKLGAGQPRPGGKKEQVCWMPARLKEGTDVRLKKNIEGLHLLVLDFDDGADVEAIRELWRPWDHWLHTTWSHTPEHPRYRLVMPLDIEAAPKIYMKLWHWAEQRCHSAGIFTTPKGPLDGKCKNTNRIWFVPYRRGEFESYVNVGEHGPLNVAHITTGVFKGEEHGEDEHLERIEDDLVFDTGRGRTSVATWASLSKPGDKVKGHCPFHADSSYGSAFLRRRKRGVLLVCTSANHDHPAPFYRWWADPRAGDDTLGPDRALADKMLWNLDKDGNRTGMKPTQHNLNLILTEDARWKNRLWHDDFTGLDYLDDEQYTNFYDIDIKAWIERAYGVSYPDRAINATVHWAADRKHRNTLREELEQYKWDGVPRMDNWLQQAIGAPDDQLHRWIGRSFLIQAAKRALEPGCTAQYVMVLVGPQGDGKSALLRELAGDEWFNDSRYNIDNKEAYMQIRGTWIYEFAELASVRGHAQLDAVKAYLTSETDTWIPKHKNEAVSVPRVTVFVGTVNDDEFLHDYTGNRRFWPVRVKKIDREWVKENRQAIWAEAYAAAKAGEQAWPEGELKEQLAEHTADFMEVDAWHHSVAAWVKRIAPPALTTETVAEHVLELPASRHGRIEQMRIGKILRACGYRRERLQTRKYGRVYAFIEEGIAKEQAREYLDTDGWDGLDNVVDINNART